MIRARRRARVSRRRDRGRICGESGFSTFELMVTVSLLGILLGMGVSGMRGAVARERVDGWARSMTFDIAAGRQAALARREAITVTVTGSGYTIAAPNDTLRQAVLPADITLTTTCPASACTFDRRGVPLAAGTITMGSASTGRTYTIRIEAGTGRVSFREP